MADTTSKNENARQDAKAARKNARKAEIKAAKEYLRNTLPTLDKWNGQVGAAVRILVSGAARGERAETGILSKVRALFSAPGFVSVDEMKLFQALKIGRNEMRKISRKLIRDSAPAERLWIQFEEDGEIWRVLGKGEKAPKGWKGYTPENLL